MTSPTEQVKNDQYFSMPVLSFYQNEYFFLPELMINVVYLRQYVAFSCLRDRDGIGMQKILSFYKLMPVF